MVGIGTSVRNSRGRQRLPVWGPTEPLGTHRAAFMFWTVSQTAMSSKADATEGTVVYRTVQESPGMMGRTVGPIFSTMEEAKAVAEDFAENGLNAAPTRWEDADEGRRSVKMVPEATRHTLAVEAVTVHESADEVMPEQPGDTEG